MDKVQSSKSSAPAITPLWLIGASLLFVTAELAVLVYFNADEKMLGLLEWIESQGMVEALLFIGLMALVVVLLLPGMFFTTGAGFVFGLVEGTIYVAMGTVLGASIAFLIARHLFGERASRFIIKRSNPHAINEEMRQHDFKIVMLTRLIPFFPGKISNYFFGLTKFRFKGFVPGSLVGFIPYSLHNVYLGAMVISFPVSV